MVINIYFSLAPLVPLLIFTSSTWRRIKFEHNQVCQNNEESTTIQQFLTNNSRASDCTRINVYYHWRIQWGRRQPVPPPPTGSNSFVFAYVFAKKCPRWRSVPPQWLGAPPQWEILDPLQITIERRSSQRQCRLLSYWLYQHLIEVWYKKFFWFVYISLFTFAMDINLSLNVSSQEDRISICYCGPMELPGLESSH